LGIGDSDYYKSFKHLNAKIIKPVTKEINKSSDIQITPEFKKQGRSISEIRFLISPNPQLPLMDIDDDDSVKGTPIYGRLMALGISHKLAQQWIVMHGEEYVREKLDYTSNQNKEGRIRGSVSGFINAAITKDYKTEKSAQKASGKKSKPAKPDLAEFKAEARRKKEKQVRRQRGEELTLWLDSLQIHRADLTNKDFMLIFEESALKIKVE